MKKEKPAQKLEEEHVASEEKLAVEKFSASEEELVDVETEVKPEVKKDVESWNPKTKLGMKVKQGVIKNIDEILDSGEAILESQITDMLLPKIEHELLFIGQSKGKFGGGARRIFRQTQKKTPEGNKPSFSCFAIIGDKNGYVGGGHGKSKDTVPAREKAIRNAKMNIFKIRRGCGSWQCGCKNPHSIPFGVSGKCGSVTIKLMPAPKGKGLCIEGECQKILRLAGVKDIWSKSYGQTNIKMNLIFACLDALKELNMMKVKEDLKELLGIKERGITTV
ncbi:30S ribosomal protein S5 [Candidatus Woesearchaeota archaeon]|nr:30S ribosomal protein S5 [Candidatus Woesearchaeota archaeon]